MLILIYIPTETELRRIPAWRELDMQMRNHIHYYRQCHSNHYLVPDKLYSQTLAEHPAEEVGTSGGDALFVL